MDIIEVVIIPPGTYVIGDPCYTVPETEWDGILEITDFFNDPAGYLPDGRLVVGFHTAYGDGSYRGTDGVLYGVDAGLIGVVQVEDGYTTDDDSVSVIVFETDTECSCVNKSIITIGNVSIDTNPEIEDEYYDEDEDTGYSD